MSKRKQDYDFKAIISKYNVLCSDGKTIAPGSFAHQDGTTIPMVWHHGHKDPRSVVGNFLLEDTPTALIGYAKFNDTEIGQHSKGIVKHGDVKDVSIWADKLVKRGSTIIKASALEGSLVMRGANPGSKITDVAISHADELFIEENISHEDGSIESCFIFNSNSITVEEEIIKHEDGDDDMTLQDVLNTFNKKQQMAVATALALLGGAEVDDDIMSKQEMKDIIATLNDDQSIAFQSILLDADNIIDAIADEMEDDDKLEQSDINEGENIMSNAVKRNVFENSQVQKTQEVLSHADMKDIISHAQTSGIGSFKESMKDYITEHFLDDDGEHIAHGFSQDDLDKLYPDNELLRPGAPEIIDQHSSWVKVVMSKTHKSPIARIKTRQLDISKITPKGSGYVKGDEKKLGIDPELVQRTTDPQTIYRREELDRDDILDITDFDVVAYEYSIMKMGLEEEIATAIMIGDGRLTSDPLKIKEQYVRPIWLDDETYTIHATVDIEAARKELQGTDTALNFGDNYVRAEAIITAALYAREQYKGSGALDFWCTPHMLNVMLLARDLNGRRIYDSKTDLAAALNVTAIHTVEQFEGKTRTTVDSKTMKLLGIFVNLSDYNVGAVKGGAITRFQQFDIDFNKEKFLMETRMSGALTRVKSAIALEEDVTPPASEG